MEARETRAAAEGDGTIAGAPSGRPLLWLLGLAILFSWAVWTPLLVAPASAVAPGRPLYYLHFLGTLGPALAAFAVAFLVAPGEREGFLARLSPRRTRPGWLLLAWSLPFVLFLATATVGWVLGAREPPAAGLAHFEKLPGFGVAAAWLFLLLVNGPGEELGWRGLAIPLLQRDRSPLAATLLLVPAWALWHAPMFFYDPVFSAMGTGEVAGWLVSLAAGGVLLTWLLNASGDNALAPVLFHAATNAVFMSEAAQGAAGHATGVLLAVAAVVVLIREGPELGRRTPVAREAALMR